MNISSMLCNISRKSIISVSCLWLQINIIYYSYQRLIKLTKHSFYILSKIIVNQIFNFYKITAKAYEKMRISKFVCVFYIFRCF